MKADIDSIKALLEHSNRDFCDFLDLFLQLNVDEITENHVKFLEGLICDETD